MRWQQGARGNHKQYNCYTTCGAACLHPHVLGWQLAAIALRWATDSERVCVLPCLRSIVDVSTLGELCRRWFPRDYARGPKKRNLHTAMSGAKAPTPRACMVPASLGPKLMRQLGARLFTFHSRAKPLLHPISCPQI